MVLAFNIRLIFDLITCTLIFISIVKPSTLTQRSQWENNEEIKILREYLRIPSVNLPNIDYSENITKKNNSKEVKISYIFRAMH